MTVHELKCHPEPFRAMASGDKSFEFRKDDRGFHVGDFLRLKEYDRTGEYTPVGNFRPPGYTGRLTLVRVTYLLRGPDFGVPVGYVVMSVVPVVTTAASSSA